jgi:hypothetical protein
MKLLEQRTATNIPPANFDITHHLQYLILSTTHTPAVASERIILQNALPIGL